LAISQGWESGADSSGSAASLLFAAGRRPEVAAIRDFVARNGEFSISFDPAADGAAGAGSAIGPSSGAEDGGWLELLANGLTFDLVGLRPGAAAEPPPCVHGYALGVGAQAGGLETLTVRPGPHIAGGHAFPPVVRSLAWLAATLSRLDGVEAVAWQPARSWSGAEYFRAGVLRWVEGGVFPGLGLTALAMAPDGGMQSEGLALFAAQDLRIEPELMRDKAEGAKIGLRLIDYLVENGPIDAPQRLAGPDGQSLRLEPSANGRFVRVWCG
jgi:hypothetical protein